LEYFFLVFFQTKLGVCFSGDIHICYTIYVLRKNNIFYKNNSSNAST
jgi:hypothetical protein